MSDTPLWKGAAIIAAVGGKADREDWVATGVSIDSRSLEKDDLFVAIVGPVHDGHDFARVAFENGASALLLSRRPEDLPADANVILVDDTLKALEDLGCAARARTNAQVVAVTGSVGKTGSKESLLHMLSRQGKTHASIGSFNNHWGVPLSLSRMPEDTKFAIFELGMNHPGELGPLSKMVRPHVALITTIEAVHLEFFSDVEAIARAKAEIFEGLTSSGSVILNGDNSYGGLLKSIAANNGITRILTFGEKSEADIRLTDFTLYPDHSDVAVKISSHEVFFRLGVPGRHWISNILGVLGAVSELGADIEKAAEALGDLQSPKGRGARHMIPCIGGNYMVVDESYNASPASMRASLEVLQNLYPDGKGRRVAVLGDMLELGEKSADIHRSLKADVCAADVDLLFTCGPNMAQLAASMPSKIITHHEETSEKLIAPLLETIGAGDIVLIKGSLGSKMRIPLEALLERRPAVMAAAEQRGR
ncbi:UDP-N-acetylmuramoylalanyl-D-glutamyl-2,6-diaminopimelate--D-alanyl-D-alanine ligase [Sneathiella sp. HT1-7]|uniref:UDP-N-acetylmuramoylalanyl-D-glutamyl-2, 6-diaminopimelate--D-alanyl-D-alanine ligase n=1 Tax=Sneathiella sp. HT1-7 TaxID=2887192 RepID=UPI001D15BBB3|nr:UDP-N-acetylmuramoylalanyl-D-glutamyl-2,6-diaminopimelate--D-alanyl-D-alanine ligase [Sneathiella sp. HT1-7]MCC3306652.1 UDP-N-acetylmuramoylalanyl-D-glutamyl-2,6-diaminopimelate--D-alanyl-D-alanine ligase [Sneathiella sp. HT1-7]